MTTTSDHFAKGRKRFPASTTDTALAPRHTRRGNARARRRLDSAHADPSRHPDPHRTARDQTRINFRQKIFQIFRISNIE